MASQRRHPRCHRDSLGSDKDNHAGPLSTTCVCFSIATTTCGYILAVTSLPVRSVVSSLATVSHTLQLLQLRITCLNSRGNPVSNYRSTTTNTTAREGAWPNHGSGDARERVSRRCTKGLLHL